MSSVATRTGKRKREDMLIHIPKELVDRFQDGQTFRGKAIKIPGKNLVRLNLELDSRPTPSESLYRFFGFWKNRRDSELVIDKRMHTLERKVSRVQKKLLKLASLSSALGDAYEKEWPPADITLPKHKASDTSPKMYVCKGNVLYKN